MNVVFESSIDAGSASAVEIFAFVFFIGISVFFWFAEIGWAGHGPGGSNGNWSYGISMCLMCVVCMWWRHANIYRGLSIHVVCDFIQTCNMANISPAISIWSETSIAVTIYAQSTHIRISNATFSFTSTSLIGSNFNITERWIRTDHNSRRNFNTVWMSWYLALQACQYFQRQLNNFELFDRCLIRKHTFLNQMLWNFAGFQRTLNMFDILINISWERPLSGASRWISCTQFCRIMWPSFLLLQQMLAFHDSEPVMLFSACIFPTTYHICRGTHLC